MRGQMCVCFFKNNWDINCGDVKELFKYIFQKIHRYLLCGGFSAHVWGSRVKGLYAKHQSKRRKWTCVCFKCFFKTSSASGFIEASHTWCERSPLTSPASLSSPGALRWLPVPLVHKKVLSWASPGKTRASSSSVTTENTYQAWPQTALVFVQVFWGFLTAWMQMSTCCNCVNLSRWFLLLFQTCSVKVKQTKWRGVIFHHSSPKETLPPDYPGVPAPPQSHGMSKTDFRTLTQSDWAT